MKDYGVIKIADKAFEPLVGPLRSRSPTLTNMTEIFDKHAKVVYRGGYYDVTSYINKKLNAGSIYKPGRHPNLYLSEQAFHWKDRRGNHYHIGHKIGNHWNIL